MTDGGKALILGIGFLGFLATLRGNGQITLTAAPNNSSSGSGLLAQGSMSQGSYGGGPFSLALGSTSGYPPWGNSSPGNAIIRVGNNIPKLLNLSGLCGVAGSLSVTVRKNAVDPYPGGGGWVTVTTQTYALAGGVFSEDIPLSSISTGDYVCIDITPNLNMSLVWTLS